MKQDRVERNFENYRIISDKLHNDKFCISYRNNDGTYDEFRLILRELKNKNMFEYDAISVAVEQMKSKSSKALIPLPNSLKEQLETWFEMNPYQNVICDEEGNFLDPDCTGHRIRGISKKIGIPFHFHLLRYTYTTYLVDAHVDVKVAQELLKHANFNTMMSVYAHVDNKKKQNIVNEVFCGENAKNKTLS